MIRRACRTSVAVSAEVGSSMMMSRDFSDSARAISTICCSATDRSRTGVIGSMLEAERAVMRARVCVACARQSTNGRRAVGSRPMKMFSATVRFGIRLNSW